MKDRGVQMIPSESRNDPQYAAREAKEFFPINQTEGAFDGFPDADDAGHPQNGSVPTDIAGLGSFATGPDIRSSYVAPKSPNSGGM